MATWEWIALWLGLLALLQLVAWQYARRMSDEDGDGNGPQPTPKAPLNASGDSDRDLEPHGSRTSNEGQASGTTEAGLESRTTEEVTCPHCGATNDPYYTYCRSCVTAIP